MHLASSLSQAADDALNEALQCNAMKVCNAQSFVQSGDQLSAALVSLLSRAADDAVNEALQYSIIRSFRWSAVSRTERYRKRCGDDGNPTVDETNPLPKLIDPITLEPVVTPAISPFGHVMGLATWKVGFQGYPSKGIHRLYC